jgi:hypothetical protein
MMRLGLDFDNTLIAYDRLFRRVALDKGLIPEQVPPQKNAVRDYLRQQDREEEWTRLQGEVYGGRILEAEPYPGMRGVLDALSALRVPMFIVSHKTRTPYLGPPCDLHAAARSWLEQQGFHDAEGLAWTQDQVYFETTKEAKVARILALGCTHYVDDLPEILAMLPDGVEKILFSVNGNAPTHPAWKRMSSWDQLPALLDLP